MKLETKYEVSHVAAFIRTHFFKRVALQIPDELLKDSTKVVCALRNELQLSCEGGNDVKDIGLYVMADTTYGSCCVDEVGAHHINADCVIHFGHTCLSPTPKLPAFFVFGKAPISASNCAKHLSDYPFSTTKPVMESSRKSQNHSQSPGVTSKASSTDTDVSDSYKSLTEKLSAALVNVGAKEDLVKQHAKVAEEAVAEQERLIGS